MEEIITSNKLNEKYQIVLKDFLQNLEKYSYLSGTEGKAYFVSDEFVVKEYSSYNYRMNEKNFDLYCSEIQNFAELGFNVPKIYAWTKFTNAFHQERFYILEERAKGKHLFNEIFDMYPKVKNKMSITDFDNAMTNHQKNPENYTKILLEYLKDINERASQIANMPDENVEKFIWSLYQLSLNGHYSFIDPVENNLMFDGEKLTIIDQGFVFEPSVANNEDNAKEQTISNVISYLYTLISIQFLSALDIKLKPKVQKIKNLIEKNKYDIALKFTKKVKTVLNFEDYDNVHKSLKRLLNEKQIHSIIEELQK